MIWLILALNFLFMNNSNCVSYYFLSFFDDKKINYFSIGQSIFALITVFLREILLLLKIQDNITVIFFELAYNYKSSLRYRIYWIYIFPH